MGQIEELARQQQQQENDRFVQELRKRSSKEIEGGLQEAEARDQN